MARFLVAWEFGEDLGHLRRLLPIGRGLRAAGHDVAFAFRDATRLWHARDAAFGAWPAPLLRLPAIMERAPLNMPDVLLNLGFRDAGSVRGVQQAWDALLDATRADVLVADYAPSALIAATRRGLKRATIGSGFALPPVGDPMPALRPGAPASIDHLRRIDAELVEVIARATGVSAGVTMRSIFEGDANILATLPELDPFGPRNADYVGPVLSDDSGVEARWTTDAPRVLAYLKPRDERFLALVEALHGARVEALVAAPGLDAGTAARLSRDTVRVVPAPLRLAPLLPGAHVCVSHGGPGFAAAALLAGVPLAVAPMHVEQDLVALRLLQQGVGIVLDGRDPAGMRDAIAAAITDTNLRGRAGALATRYAGLPQRDAASEAAKRIAALAT